MSTYFDKHGKPQDEGESRIHSFSNSDIEKDLIKGFQAQMDDFVDSMEDFERSFRAVNEQTGKFKKAINIEIFKDYQSAAESCFSDLASQFESLSDYMSDEMKDMYLDIIYDYKKEFDLYDQYYQRQMKKESKFLRNWFTEMEDGFTGLASAFETKVIDVVNAMQLQQIASNMKDDSMSRLEAISEAARQRGMTYDEMKGFKDALTDEDIFGGYISASDILAVHEMDEVSQKYLEDIDSYMALFLKETNMTADQMKQLVWWAERTGQEPSEMEKTMDMLQMVRQVNGMDPSVMVDFLEEMQDYLDPDNLADALAAATALEDNSLDVSLLKEAMEGSFNGTLTSDVMKKLGMLASFSGGEADFYTMVQAAQSEDWDTFTREMAEGLHAIGVQGNGMSAEQLKVFADMLGMSPADIRRYGQTDIDALVEEIKQNAELFENPQTVEEAKDTMGYVSDAILEQNKLTVSWLEDIFTKLNEFSLDHPMLAGLIGTVGASLAGNLISKVLGKLGGGLGNLFKGVFGGSGGAEAAGAAAEAAAQYGDDIASGLFSSGDDILGSVDDLAKAFGTNADDISAALKAAGIAEKELYTIDDIAKAVGSSSEELIDLLNGSDEALEALGRTVTHLDEATSVIGESASAVERAAQVAEDTLGTVDDVAGAVDDVAAAAGAVDDVAAAAGAVDDVAAAVGKGASAGSKFLKALPVIGAAIEGVVGAVEVGEALERGDEREAAGQTGETIGSIGGGLAGGAAGGVAGGAAAGALAGSVVPGIGTIIGALIGVAGGVIGGAIGGAAGREIGEKAYGDDAELPEEYRDWLQGQRDVLKDIEAGNQIYNNETGEEAAQSYMDEFLIPELRKMGISESFLSDYQEGPLGGNHYDKFFKDIESGSYGAVDNFTTGYEDFFKEQVDLLKQIASGEQLYNHETGEEAAQSYMDEVLIPALREIGVYDSKLDEYKEGFFGGNHYEQFLDDFDNGAFGTIDTSMENLVGLGTNVDSTVAEMQQLLREAGVDISNMEDIESGVVSSLSNLVGLEGGNYNTVEKMKKILQNAGVDIGGMIDDMDVIAAFCKSLSYLLEGGGSGSEGEGEAETEGSHALGIDRIPHDNYVANLHEGEAVLTAGATNELSRILEGGYFDNIIENVETLAGLNMSSLMSNFLGSLGSFQFVNEQLRANSTLVNTDTNEPIGQGSAVDVVVESNRFLQLILNELKSNLRETNSYLNKIYTLESKNNSQQRTQNQRYSVSSMYYGGGGRYTY